MDEINISGELHGQLMELLSAGRREEAVAQLALEQGLSPEVSAQVIDQLQPPVQSASPAPPGAVPPAAAPPVAVPPTPPVQATLASNPVPGATPVPPVQPLAPEKSKMAWYNHALAGLPMILVFIGGLLGGLLGGLAYGISMALFNNKKIPQPTAILGSVGVSAVAVVLYFVIAGAVFDVLNKDEDGKKSAKKQSSVDPRPRAGGGKPSRSTGITSSGDRNETKEEKAKTPDDLVAEAVETIEQASGDRRKVEEALKVLEEHSALVPASLTAAPFFKLCADQEHRRNGKRLWEFIKERATADDVVEVAQLLAFDYHGIPREDILDYLREQESEDVPSALVNVFNENREQLLRFCREGDKGFHDLLNEQHWHALLGDPSDRDRFAHVVRAIKPLATEASVTKLQGVLEEHTPKLTRKDGGGQYPQILKHYLSVKGTVLLNRLDSFPEENGVRELVQELAKEYEEGRGRFKVCHDALLERGEWPEGVPDIRGDLGRTVEAMIMTEQLEMWTGPTVFNAYAMVAEKADLARLKRVLEAEKRSTDALRAVLLAYMRIDPKTLYELFEKNGSENREYRSFIHGLGRYMAYVSERDVLELSKLTDTEIIRDVVNLLKDHGGKFTIDKLPNLLSFHRNNLEADELEDLEKRIERTVESCRKRLEE